MENRTTSKPTAVSSKIGRSEPINEPIYPYVTENEQTRKRAHALLNNRMTVTTQRSQVSSTTPVANNKLRARLKEVFEKEKQLAEESLDTTPDETLVQKKKQLAEESLDTTLDETLVQKKKQLAEESLDTTSDETLVQRNRYQKFPTNYGQWLCREREKRGWTQGQLANILGKPTTAIRRWEKNQAYPDITSRQKLAKLVGKEAPSLQVAEKGITGFFNGLAKTFVSGIIGAALFPFVGPVIATAAAITTLMVTSIQDELEPLGLHLQEDTINQLTEPLHGKPFDEHDLRKVIEDVLSDRQANNDLKKFFIDLIPTIQKAAGSTNIEISGPVQSLIVGDHNTITQTFDDFLKE